MHMETFGEFGVPDPGQGLVTILKGVHLKSPTANLT